VVQRTIESPQVSRTPAGEPSLGRFGRFGLLGDAVVRRRAAILTCAGLLLISVVLVLAAGTRPGFDPYGWLVWGHQTLQWNLDTNGAPSWKPLPYLFTVPYALIGRYALWLWFITAVAVSLGGMVWAGRIAYRLTGPAAGRRYAALGAAAFAGLMVLQIRDYSHFVLSAQSDTMIAAMCLGAVDFHLSKRPRLAFTMLVLASLGRPEAWPFAGLYALWALRTIPAMRVFVVAGLALIPLLWFGIPALTAKSFFVAGDLALHSPRALHGNKLYGVLDRFLDLHEAPLEIAALVSVGIALYRRDVTTLALAAAVLLWFVVEVAFALHGWPAVPRYLFEPVALMAVVAAVGVGRVLEGTAGRLRAPGWAGILVVVALLVTLVPAASSRVKVERADLTHERARASQINVLNGVIARVGGATRVRACGTPVTVIEFESILAWETGVNVGVTFIPNHLVGNGHPAIVFLPTRHGGWRLVPTNIAPSKQARCAAMRVTVPG
jgi:hypothetical protein